MATVLLNFLFEYDINVNATAAVNTNHYHQAENVDLVNVVNSPTPASRFLRTDFNTDNSKGTREA